MRWQNRLFSKKLNHTHSVTFATAFPLYFTREMLVNEGDECEHKLSLKVGSSAEVFLDSEL